MATQSTVVDLIFNGVDRTSAATAAVLGNLSKFSDGASSITQGAADITAGAAKLEAGILATGAAVVSFAVVTAKDFDAAFRQISTLFDATDDDLAGFRQSILDYASTSSKSLDDITQSISAAVGSGVEWSKSLDLISQAEKLAVATRSDLKGTTEVLVGTMNAYGLKTESVGKVSDLFFKIIADGKIEMKDLSQYLANVTPVAAAAGVGLEEVGAAIATLTAAGVGPSTAIDSIKSALSNIIKPSEQAAKLAAELGIEFDASALKAKGLSGVLKDVAEKTGGSADKMAILFGDVTGLASVLTLTGPQADTFAKSLKGMGDAAGVVDAAFAKMTGSAEEAGAKIENAMKALLVQIGTPLLDEVGGIGTAIAKIFNSLGASVKDGNLGGLVAYVESVLGDIQTAVDTVAKNLPEALAKADLKPFKDGIEAVSTSIKSLFGNIDLTTVDGLTKGIELAGAAFLGLSRYVAGAIESFKPLFDALVSAAEGAGKLDSSFLTIAGNIGGALTQINLMLPALDALIALMAVNAGVGIVSGLTAMATTMPLLIPLAQALGATLAAAFAYKELDRLVQAFKDLYDAQNKLNESSKQTGAVQKVTNDVLADFAKNTGFVVKSLDEAEALIKSGAVAWDSATQKYVEASKAQKEVADSTEKLTGLTDQEIEAQIKNATAAGNARRATEELAQKKADLAAVMVEKVVPVFDAATGKIIGYETQLVKVAAGSKEASAQQALTAGAIKKSAEEAKKAEEATRRWNEEIQKMQHVEKLALIEAQSKITTAQIEADAEKTVAAFESINAGIQSTGETISKLVGELAGLDGLDKVKVWDIIEEEMKLRQQEFALQKDLVQQQIALMKAKVSAMQKGEALIKIEGDGLKPHLEAFMWEILRTIQTRVNADGLDMLLGA